MLRRLNAAALLSAGMLLSATAMADPASITLNTSADPNDPTTTYPGSSVVFSVTGSGNNFAIYAGSASEITLNMNFNAVVVADVNRDGSPDLLFGMNSSAGGGVQVLLNDGTGSGIVVYKTTLSTGATKATDPTGLAVVDVNGDGWPDVLTSNGIDGTVSVLLNDRSGGFAAPQLYPAGNTLSALTVVDVNGDGHPDIVALDSGNNAVDVLINAGNGTFGAAVTLPLGSTPDVLLTADLDNDGDLDIITADSSAGTVEVLLNDGHGNYAAAVPYSVGLFPESIQVKDVNGDGVPDIVAYDILNQSQVVLLNKGDGSFVVQSVTSNACTRVCLSIGGVDLFGASALNAGGVNLSGSISAPTLNVGGANISLANVGGTLTVASNGSSSKTSAATPKAASASSSGGGAMAWLTILILGAIASMRRRWQR